jgi:DNA-binding SARP family transcriptional activator
LGAQAAARVRSVPGGYLLVSEDGELDLQVFTDRCRRGRALMQVRDWIGAADAFAAGLALWRGAPLADLPATGFFQAQSQWLVELRLQALRSRIEADLLVGRHDQLVAELTALTAGYPLTEAFHGQLMLALYRTGRACDALSVYERASRALREDLGVDPGPDLTGMHERILNHDPDLTWRPLLPNTAGSGR